MHTQPRQLDFEQIVRDTHSRVRAYIAGLGVVAHEVDDLAQDVYIEFYKNQTKIPAEVEPERWLKGIARNLCMNHFRSKSRRGRLHREMLAEVLAQVELGDFERTADWPASDVLGGCLDRLSAENRQLVSLRYSQELPAASIAERLETTAEAVRVALFRVRARLRDCIGRSLAREEWQ